MFDRCGVVLLFIAVRLAAAMAANLVVRIEYSIESKVEVGGIIFAYILRCLKSDFEQG